MNRERITAEIETELDAVRRIAQELSAIARDVENGLEPDLRLSTAASGFLQSFYNGLEAIFKRFCALHGVPIPSGESFHVELAKLFDGSEKRLPALLEGDMWDRLGPYRSFRHVYRQLYSFDLRWDFMAEGVSEAEGVLDEFERRVRVSLHHH